MQVAFFFGLVHERRNPIHESFLRVGLPTKRQGSR